MSSKGRSSYTNSKLSSQPTVMITPVRKPVLSTSNKKVRSWLRAERELQAAEAAWLSSEGMGKLRKPRKACNPRISRNYRPPRQPVCLVMIGACSKISGHAGQIRGRSGLYGSTIPIYRPFIRYGKHEWKGSSS